MSATYSETLSQTSDPDLEYVRYFPRQLITADDMRAEQEYFREKLRRHNRILHGWGIACGCQVMPVLQIPGSAPNPPWLVSVSEGFAITPSGNEIYIPDGVTFDLAGDSEKTFDPCPQPTPCSQASTTAASPNKNVYLAACYVECNTQPVRISPAGCDYTESACEYSRTRESFELVRLDADLSYSPDCDCVVLAVVQLPETKTASIITNQIIQQGWHPAMSTAPVGKGQ